MKFLCLACGSEAGWKAVSKRKQLNMLAQEQVLKGTGDYLAEVQTKFTAVTHWTGDLKSMWQVFCSAGRAAGKFFNH